MPGKAYHALDNRDITHVPAEKIVSGKYRGRKATPLFPHMTVFW